MGPGSVGGGFTCDFTALFWGWGVGEECYNMGLGGRKRGRRIAGVGCGVFFRGELQDEVGCFQRRADTLTMKAVS